MATRTINTVLQLKDNASKHIVGVSKKVSGLSKDMQKMAQKNANAVSKMVKGFEKVGDKAVKLGATIAAVSAGAIIKIGIDGMKELDEASAKVKSIAGASLDKKVISKGLLKASNQTGINTTELGNTQYDAISSGVDSKESLAAAITSAKLAKAGFTDANSSLKILTSTMNVYGLKGQKAMQGISDKLLITQNLGVTTVQELAESMGSVTPIANSAGLSIDELMSSMVSLTKNGIKTDEATTEMKGILTSIIAPTKESSDMAKKLGINFSASALKSKGFVKFMEEIKKKTGGNTEKMAGLFGNVRALTGALVLAGGGFKDLDGAMSAMKNSTGATDDAFNVMNDTIGSKFNKLKNRLKNTATSIMEGTGGKLGEMVTKVSDKLKELDENGTLKAFADKVAESFGKLYDAVSKTFDFIHKHKTTIEVVAITLFSFYAAIKIVTTGLTILKGVLIAVNIITGLLNGTLAISPIGWVTIAIAALIAIGILLWKNWDKIKVKAGELWKSIQGAFGGVVEWFNGIWDGAKKGFRGFINFIIDGLNLWISAQLSPLNFLIDMANKLPNVKIPNIKLEVPHIPEFAKGTKYSPCGMALINEKGGEIRRLSNGETIIPADKSDRLIKKANMGGNTYNFYFTGNVGEESFFEKCGNYIVQKIKETEPRMA